jgi:hypothetical protein
VPPPGGFVPASSYGNAATGSGSNGLAVASLVIGIISLFGIFCFGIGGLVLGLVAVGLGIGGLRRANRAPGAPQKGVAIGGIVTGALGALVGLAFLVFIVVLGNSEELNSIDSDPSDGVCDESRFWQDPDC